METQDVHSAGRLSKEEALQEYKKALGSIKPITDTSVVLNICQVYLESCSVQIKEECMLAIGVYLRLFTNMKRSIQGDTLDSEAIESMFMGESMLLELNNGWYNKFKPLLTPAIADSKISLLSAHRMRQMQSEAPHETTDDAIWSLLIASWNFIPWFIFTATGNLNSYIASKEILMRMITMSKEELIR